MRDAARQATSIRQSVGGTSSFIFVRFFVIARGALALLSHFGAFCPGLAPIPGFAANPERSSAPSTGHVSSDHFLVQVAVCCCAVSGFRTGRCSCHCNGSPGLSSSPAHDMARNNTNVTFHMVQSWQRRPRPSMLQAWPAKHLNDEHMQWFDR